MMSGRMQSKLLRAPDTAMPMQCLTDTAPLLSQRRPTSLQSDFADLAPFPSFDKGEITLRVHDKLLDWRSEYDVPKCCTVEEFPKAITAMLEEHRPSRMPFFERLATMPRVAADDPFFLGQIHLIYQSAMHATRAAV